MFVKLDASLDEHCFFQIGNPASAQSTLAILTIFRDFNLKIDTSVNISRLGYIRREEKPAIFQKLS